MRVAAQKSWPSQEFRNSLLCGLLAWVLRFCSLHVSVWHWDYAVWRKSMKIHPAQKQSPVFCDLPAAASEVSCYVSLEVILCCHSLWLIVLLTSAPLGSFLQLENHHGDPWCVCAPSTPLGPDINPFAMYHKVSFSLEERSNKYENCSQRR